MHPEQPVALHFHGIVEATKIAHGYPWDIVIDSKKESELRNRLKKNILSNQNSK